MKIAGHKLTSTLAAAAMLLPLSTGITGASAADMLGEGNAYSNVEFGTGWYLRGEVGATIKKTTTEITANGNAVFGGSNEIGRATTFGVGGGYTFGNGLRAEVGLNHFTGFAYAADSGNYSCGSYEDEVQEVVDVQTFNPPRVEGGVLIPGFTTTTQEVQTVTRVIQDQGTCNTKYQANISATTLMGTAYIDGPEFWGITPYAGVGAGLAVITWNNFEDFDLCRGNNSVDCRGEGAGIHTFREGEAVTQTSFAPAWSIALGAAYNVSKNVKLDVGYRYTNIAGTTVASSSENRFFRSDLETDTIHTHEVRVGLRYEIW